MKDNAGALQIFKTASFWRNYLNFKNAILVAVRP